MLYLKGGDGTARHFFVEDLAADVVEGRAPVSVPNPVAAFQQSVPDVAGVVETADVHPATDRESSITFNLLRS